MRSNAGCVRILEPAAWFEAVSLDSAEPRNMGLRLGPIRKRVAWPAPKSTGFPMPLQTGFGLPTLPFPRVEREERGVINLATGMNLSPLNTTYGFIFLPFSKSPSGGCREKRPGLLTLPTLQQSK